MRFGSEKVTKVENLVPVLQISICDEDGEAVRTEIVTCEGKSSQCRAMVGGMPDDPLNDFPRESWWHDGSHVGEVRSVVGWGKADKDFVQLVSDHSQLTKSTRRLKPTHTDQHRPIYKENGVNPRWREDRFAA